MIKDLTVHTCDECGKTFTEERQGKWISGWYKIRTSTSSFYGTNLPDIDICSPECMISYAAKQKEKKK